MKGAKLEFLDIDLNIWSVVLFFFQALFLLSITFMIFAGNSARLLFILVMFFFILNQVVTVAYGIISGQIGFIMMVVFQFFLTLMTFGYLNRGLNMLGNIDDNQ